MKNILAICGVLLMGATPALAQDWQGSTSAEQGWFWGWVRPNDASMLIICSGSQPGADPMIGAEDGPHPVYGLTIEMMQADLSDPDFTAPGPYSRNDLILVTEATGYLLPAANWQELNGERWESIISVGDPLIAALLGGGGVQAWAPKLLRAGQGSEDQMLRAARTWVSLLIFVPACLALLVAMTPAPAPWLTAVLVLGLLAFGAIFAVNSALHSYLILALTSAERVTMDVGFYYMSNAAGRLLGTLLSGASYQLGGLPLCLAMAALMLLASALATARLGKG